MFCATSYVCLSDCCWIINSGMCHNLSERFLYITGFIFALEVPHLEIDTERNQTLHLLHRPFWKNLQNKIATSFWLEQGSCFYSSGGPDPRFQCDICGKVCYHRIHLQEHKNSVHFHVMPHACDNCGKKFSYRASMIRHRKLCGMVAKTSQSQGGGAVIWSHLWWDWSGGNQTSIKHIFSH